MQVAKYTYQSPSTSPVQVGKLDPSSLKESNTKSSNSLPNAVTSPTQEKAQSFASTQQTNVKPTVTANAIDIYA